MVIGWIITKTYGSGFTEFLQLSDQNLKWTEVSRQCTIFRDQPTADAVIQQLAADERVELVPVEAHC
jgi:hypothetical protein